MAQTRTLNTLAWNTLYAMWTSFEKENKTTAASRILEYVDAQIAASVAAGLGTEEQVKASVRNNCYSDKKSRFGTQLRSATGAVADELRHKLELVAVFGEYTKGFTRKHVTNASAKPTTSTVTDGRTKYLPSKGTLTKSKWRYTADELQEFEGDYNFWNSVYQNSVSAEQKQPEICQQYFGADWQQIMYKARNFAAAKAKEGNLSLEEKIKRGIAVVITPAVIAELQRLYPNGATGTESTGECMEEVDPSSIAHEDVDTKEVVIEDAEVSDITAVVPVAAAPPTPTVDINVMAAAKQLADICKATDDQMIHGYELDVDWDDIDDMLDKIVKTFPDTFEYDEETDEILYIEN